MPLSRRLFLAGCAAVAAQGLLPAAAHAAAPLSKFKPAGTGGFDHAAFETILAGVVQPDGEGYNRVNYRGLKPKSATLEGYLASMQAASPSQFSQSGAMAFWINLYNAKTLAVVVERYPVASIKKINLGGGGLFGSGPWSANILTVEGQELSLDDIEHRILRPHFNDPMLHYALNCASYSCPNLATSAFTAGNAEALMLAGAKDYINHPRGMSVDGSSITASKIYAWYSADFGGKPKLKTHWLRFAASEKQAAISAANAISFDYDWRLNDV